MKRCQASHYRYYTARLGDLLFGFLVSQTELNKFFKVAGFKYLVILLKN